MLTPREVGMESGVPVRIKNRSQASGWWNGKGVVMSLVRCYLRSFARFAVDFGSDMDSPFGFRIG